ncbi:MAG TPA: DUF4242 domain-containing protein [Deinococcales bacterium]|nr:DUF4242 domain-containing protein [Deinococcales bacterium]
MPVFMADRNLPGITMEQLASAQQAAIRESEKSTQNGIPVRYIRSTFVPGDARVMCLFEAGNADAVRAVNDTAGIPYERVVEANDLTPA